MGLKKPENHAVPYSLTEEFVCAYRMHPLLPDNLQLRDISATPGPDKSLPVIKEYDEKFDFRCAILVKKKNHFSLKNLSFGTTGFL